MEEPIQTEGSDRKVEKPEEVPGPAVSRIPSSAKRRPADLIKGLIGAAINNLRDLGDCVSDIEADCLRRTRGANSQLTLLKLGRYSRIPFIPRGQCPICRSAKIVPKVPVRCKSPDGESNFALYLDPVPTALNFQQHGVGPTQNQQIQWDPLKMGQIFPLSRNFPPVIFHFKEYNEGQSPVSPARV